MGFILAWIIFSEDDLANRNFDKYGISNSRELFSQGILLKLTQYRAILRVTHGVRFHFKEGLLGWYEYLRYMHSS